MTRVDEHLEEDIDRVENGRHEILLVRPNVWDRSAVLWRGHTVDECIDEETQETRTIIQRH